MQKESGIDDPNLLTDLRNTLSPGAVMEAFRAPPCNPIQLLRDIPFIGIGGGIGIAFNEGVIKLLEQPIMAGINQPMNSSEFLLIWTAYSLLITGVTCGSAVTARHFARNFYQISFPLLSLNKDSIGLRPPE